MIKIPEYTVIRDSREKKGHGWIFEEHSPDKRPPRCKGTIVSGLKTGDYTVEGYEDLLCIERKRAFGELWNNYKERERFENEMLRMQDIKYRYILIESQITPDHFDLSPAQFTRSVPGKAVVRWLMYIGIRYDVKIMFVGQCGKKLAQMIFEEVVRQEKSRWT